MSIDADFVTEQIRKNVYTLSPRHKGRSFMWSILAEIIKEDGSYVEGLLHCRTCSRLLKYNPQQTSNLIRHKCCQMLKESNSLKCVTEEDKKLAIDMSVAWITEDCKPYSAISGSGFSKLAKFFLKIGAKYGENVDILDMLPDATTLCRKTEKIAADKKNEIKDEIAEIAQSGEASATIDLWPDNYVHRNFLGVTFHYQKNMKLYDIVLGIKSMDFDHSTAVDILYKLNGLFGEFGINNTQEIKFVTDKGSKVVKALEDNIRLNSSSHLFANVLELSFNDTLEIKELVLSCRKIVKYFKKANLQYMLPSSLKSECPIPWNLNFTKFKSIVDNWLQVKKILKEKEENQGLLLINIPALTELVDLWSSFEIIFQKLELFSSSSLCFVIPSIKKVKILCIPKETDVAAILSLKKNINKNLDKIWNKNLSLWEKTAFFLYPPALSVSQTDLTEIKNFCISQINKKISSSLHCMPTSPSTSYSDFESQLSPSDSNCAIETSAETSNQSQLKKDVQFFFSDLLKKPTTSTTNAPNEEIERYSRANIEITDDFDVLYWWKLNEKSYPILSEFALQVLSIPASNTASERAFSLAGNVISDKRNRLGPKSVDSLLFLHSYYKNLKVKRYNTD